MFEILKNKLKKAIKSISEKIEKKEEEKPKKTFEGIKEKIVKVITEKQLSEEDIEPILNDFEKDLIEADVAYEVAEKIKEDLKKNLVGKAIKRGKEKEVVFEALKQSLLEILTVPEVDLIKLAENKKPFVILFLGFNGSGKTTTLAKIGKWLVDSGYSCVFAAADTFRAASIEQLEEHGKKLGIRVIKQKYGADPAAVVYDAIEYAKANGIDFVLADTAGRAHTNKNLLDQMKKIIRVNKPGMKILVLDSLTGNDILYQCKFFDEALNVDALIFTKVDVNEKGGNIISSSYILKKPILFLCTGQNYENLEKYDPNKVLNAILS